MRALFLKISKDNRPFPHYAPVSKHKEMITVFCPPKARVGAFVYRNIECLEGLYCDKV